MMQHRTIPPDRELRPTVNRLFGDVTSSAYVAGLLRARGIKGERGRCRRCPIAVLLTRETGSTVEVYGASAHYAFGNARSSDLGFSSLPAAVEDFVRVFDNEDTDQPMPFAYLAEPYNASGLF
jgi:hypothetical protein